MQIMLNGQPKQVSGVTTIDELLLSLDLDPNRVAVEHNRKVTPRADFAEAALADGDHIEIVQFVGGG